MTDKDKDEMFVMSQVRDSDQFFISVSPLLVHSLIHLSHRFI